LAIEEGEAALVTAEVEVAEPQEELQEGEEVPGVAGAEAQREERRLLSYVFSHCERWEIATNLISSFRNPTGIPAFSLLEEKKICW